MARAQKQPGELGAVTPKPYRGRWRARTIIRNGAGELVPLVSVADTPEESLALIEQRANDIWGGLFSATTHSTLFSDVAEAWLKDLRCTAGQPGYPVQSSVDTYASNLKNILLPTIGAVPLSAIDVKFCNRLFKQLASVSHARMQTGRRVLSMVLGYAVAEGPLEHNPVTSAQRLRRAVRKQKVAYDEQQIVGLLTLVRAWRGKNPERRGGARPDVRLMEDLILVCLGTSCRPGEALALRREDVVLGDVTYVHIGATVKRDSARGLHRQPHPKHSEQTRSVPVPEYTRRVLVSRMQDAPTGADWLLFPARGGKPLERRTVHRLFIQFREQHQRELRALDIDPDTLTLKAFRKTAATTVSHGMSVSAASEMLGHATTAITEQFYNTPHRTVNEEVAQVMDKAFARLNEFTAHV